MMNKADKIKLLMVVCGIVAVLGYLGVKSMVKASQVKPFENHLSEYVSVPELKDATESPYIAGKIIPIDTKNKEVDDVYFELPENLKAEGPEEVGTVMWTECHNITVGKYADGAEGYQIMCMVTLIDKENHVRFAPKGFIGSKPPQSKKGAGSRYGSKPDKDIVEYLATLPVLISTD
jgi:hypothetical protein